MALWRLRFLMRIQPRHTDYWCISQEILMGRLSKLGAVFSQPNRAPQNPYQIAWVEWIVQTKLCSCLKAIWVLKVQRTHTLSEKISLRSLAIQLQQSMFSNWVETVSSCKISLSTYQTINAIIIPIIFFLRVWKYTKKLSKFLTGRGRGLLSVFILKQKIKSSTNCNIRNNGFFTRCVKFHIDEYNFNKSV